MTTVPATISERVPAPAPPAPSGGAAANLTPGDVVRIIRGRMVLIVVLSVFFTVLMAGLFMLWYIKYPTYAADALIQCISNAPKDPYSVTARSVHKDEHERFLNDQALIFRQPDLLLKVLETPEVKGTQWYQSLPDVDERYSDLKKKLQATPVRDSNYVRVSIGTRSPGDPHQIVREAVEIYLTKAKDDALVQWRDDLSKYQEESSRLQSQIQGQMRLIAQFAKTVPEGVLGAQNRAAPTVVEQELLDAQRQVTELELQTLELEGIQSIYDDPRGPGITAEDRQLVELNPEVQNLRYQQMGLVQRRESLSKRFGPNHREVESVQATLEAVEKQLQQTRDRKLQDSIQLKMEQVRTALFNSQAALYEAQDRLMKAKAKQKDIESKLQEYARLNDELDFLQVTREKVNEYTREIERIIQKQSAIQVKVVQWPLKPIERALPKFFFVLGAPVLAVALAIGFALLLELVDTSVRTPRDIARYLNIPILGTVPDCDDEEVNIERIEMAVRDWPNSMVSEAFRAMRTALQFSAPPERQRAVLITSPSPADGKTTVACNLAASLAIGGRRILLVDANFRRPALHAVFGVKNTQGLSNILVGAGQLNGAIIKTDLPNLDVLPSGPTPPNPAERLGSPLMHKFLEEATRMYDQVLLDAPPALLASDASVLASMLDGAILVIRAKENSRGIAQRAATVLKHVNAHVFGAVLNAAQAQRGGYFREQLRTFYDYQAEGELTAPTQPGSALPPPVTGDDKPGSTPDDTTPRPPTR